MSGTNNATKPPSSSRPTRTVIGVGGQPPPPQTSSIPIPGVSGATAAANVAAERIFSAANNMVSPRENLIRSTAKAQNRHTIAISNENYDNFANSLASKLTNEDTNQKKLKNIPQQSSFESSNNNSSPLSKTPDSTSNNENWLTLNDSSSMGQYQMTHPKMNTNDVSAFVGTSGIRSSSAAFYHTDSDHDMLDSSSGANLMSPSGGGAISDDDLDPISSMSSASTAKFGSSNSSSPAFDDFTSKRLHAFIATTLHFEHVYLAKLNRLLAFKQYLDEFYSGSQADVSVIFTGIGQIKTTHEIVARKLQDYLDSLSELYAARSNDSSTSHGKSGMITKLNQVVGSSRQATNLTPTQAQPPLSLQQAATHQLSNVNELLKESFLSKALQLLANIMEISFPVYFEFLKNYPKAMTILNKLEKSPSAASRSIHLLSKRKSFIECQLDFNKSLRESEAASSLSSNAGHKKAGFLSKITTTKSGRQTSHISKDPFNIYYSDMKRSSEEKFDIARMLSEDILRRPTKLFEFTCSLKDECMLASKELPASYRTNLESNIKSLFENESSKKLREKVFDEINRNIMPIEVRKSEDVVELIESNNDRKLRHLILYGDCLVCCRLKKEKRQLKWFIRIDQLEIFLDDCKSAKSDIELRQLREEVASLRGNLKRQAEENASARNQLKIKKKLAEQENELTLQSSRLKLIVRENPSLSQHQQFHSSSSTSSTSSTTTNTSQNISNSGGGGFFYNNSLTNALSTSMNNLANLALSTASNQSNHHHHHHHHQPKFNTTGAVNIGGYTNGGSSSMSSSNNSFSNPTTVSSFSFNNSSNNTFVFLFTSDFERNSWLEEINAAIYAYKTRNKPVDIHHSDIEARINVLKKIEEPPKVVTSSYTGSLELLVKHIEELSEPNKVFVAVELKSCGSYLQVAQTRCTDLTSKPVWNEKFNLELQAVDSLRIILYSQTSGKALAIASQELRIDSNVNLNKINCAKLTNGMALYISMKFLSPKKTITRRRTRNRNDIFGGNLTELLQREKSTIPRILKDCVEIIETRGIEEVGIYRVSSVVSEVQKMKELYCKNPNQALAELRQKSPHLSANLLKLYLRELPDPLFTSSFYQRFMEALDCSLVEFRLAELCRVFNELPNPNKTIILFLLNHLLNIASRSEKNMMGLQNLCTLFGPTLMKLSPPKSDNLQMEDMNKEIKESMQQAQVLFYILQLHAEDKLINDGVLDSSSILKSASSSPDQLTVDNNSDLERTELNTIDNNNNNLSSHLIHQVNYPTVTSNQRNQPPASSSNASTERYTKLSMQTAL